MSDSARETQIRWHMCSGGSDRLHVQGQPGLLSVRKRENHREVCHDEVEVLSGETERGKTPPQALGCSSCWSRVEGAGRELAIQKHLSRWERFASHSWWQAHNWTHFSNPTYCSFKIPLLILCHTHLNRTNYFQYNQHPPSATQEQNHAVCKQLKFTPSFVLIPCEPLASTSCISTIS